MSVGKYSKEKGKRGEREAVKLLKEYGFNAHRTAQYCGKSGLAADVVGLDGIALEIKNVERLNIDKAYAQCVRDSFEHFEKTNEELIPVVMFKRNRVDFKVCLSARDFLKMYKELLELRKIVSERLESGRQSNLSYTRL